MSVAELLIKGQDLNCADVYNKYYQNIVLVNKADVDTFLVRETDLLNAISFNLKAGKTGFLFTTSEIGETMKASFSKSTTKGISFYKHKLEMPVIGVGNSSKTLLKQLDLSNYFGAIQFKDNTVEILGFEFCLKTPGYDYQPQGSLGGAVLSLESKFDEYSPPYIYQADPKSTPTLDFNALFADLPGTLAGDFNDDFNDDFNIEEL